MFYIRLYTYIENRTVWKWLWNSQNFRCWVFRSSKYPPNGHPNFEAIWRPFVENSPIHLRTHNGRTVDYERSGLSPELHYKPDRELGWYHWKQHARLIFYWENMDHVMCFRTQGGSPLKNPLQTELETLVFLMLFSPYFRHFIFEL